MIFLYPTSFNANIGNKPIVFKNLKFICVPIIGWVPTLESFSENLFKEQAIPFLYSNSLNVSDCLKLKDEFVSKKSKISLQMKQLSNEVIFFLNKSNIIVLDEPFVGLDTYAQNVVESFLIKEINSGKALIYTSHINCNIDSKILNLR